jgi:ribonuclease D
VAPGRILPDAAIMAAALADPADVQELTALPGFGGRATRKLARIWLRALTDAGQLPDTQLPAPAAPSDGPPPPHRWAERDPTAAERLARCRAAINHIGEEIGVPPENLVLPDSVRRLAWSPPEPATEQTTGQALAGYGARQWQIRLTAGPLASALAAP